MRHLPCFQTVRQLLICHTDRDRFELKNLNRAPFSFCCRIWPGSDRASHGGVELFRTCF